MSGFLPISRQDMAERGYEQLDFIFISGDAYVDHPSFGPAILCRLLEKHGYKVGIIPQPDWHSTRDFDRLGKPRLGFLVSAGNMDSLLNKFTAARKMRHQDAYSPGGRPGCRPDRATIVYCNRLRERFPDVPILIGGIEASLRRFAHYDYWSNAVRRSILVDSGADLLIFGMGERALLEVAADLQQGVAIQNIQDVPGTCYRVPNREYVWDYLELPSYAAVSADKKKFAEAFRLFYLEQDPIRGRRLIQQNEEWCVVQNPPSPPLSEAQMDEIYDLPYQRTWHPVYDKAGGVPAIQEVQFSLVSHRGCFGGCHFCAILSHEGRIIQRRSHASLIREAKILTRMKGFKGYIHDVGGPTANFRRMSCDGQRERGTCRGKPCLSPVPCQNLIADHSDYLRLLRELRAVPGVKKVFVRSGIRFDYLLLAKDDFLEELCRYHISGQLKIAPEHISDRVTYMMGKSGRRVYQRFAEKFRQMNQKLGLKQYLVPYFMSSHPGAHLEDAIELAEFIRDMGYHPQQVQDFIPTPGTLSTCMWYTGLNPLTGEPVYTAKTYEEKQMQRALMQYWLPKNQAIVRKALHLAHREDLIGFGKQCLVRPGNAEPREKRRHRADRAKESCTAPRGKRESDGKRSRRGTEYQREKKVRR
ncbi:YgiQ family radical SAM protein [Selenomonas montiformis]|uniref:YgiQ family radical SAM protein n=1 Tax=Selenomonas montiformis TaxID=2652285 RepID=A0A6I2UXG9_9FIRM|nr:YgiQ family radical SAM protein [Selenomonas montiformis]MSV25877.1 YgiQ family radical SAM protein [Selenomonas montiformis]